MISTQLKKKKRRWIDFEYTLKKEILFLMKVSLLWPLYIHCHIYSYFSGRFQISGLTVRSRVSFHFIQFHQWIIANVVSVGTTVYCRTDRNQSGPISTAYGRWVNTLLLGGRRREQQEGDRKRKCKREREKRVLRISEWISNFVKGYFVTLSANKQNRCVYLQLKHILY